MSLHARDELLDVVLRLEPHELGVVVGGVVAAEHAQKPRPPARARDRVGLRAGLVLVLVSVLGLVLVLVSVLGSGLVLGLGLVLG